MRTRTRAAGSKLSAMILWRLCGQAQQRVERCLIMASLPLLSSALSDTQLRCDFWEAFFLGLASFSPLGGHLKVCGFGLWLLGGHMYRNSASARAVRTWITGHSSSIWQCCSLRSIGKLNFPRAVRLGGWTLFLRSPRTPAVSDSVPGSPEEYEKLFVLGVGSRKMLRILYTAWFDS